VLRLGSIALVLTISATALAQQATEWRPSLNEDNKAATLEDTFGFIKTMAMTAENATVPGRGEMFTSSLTTTDRCSIHLNRGMRCCVHQGIAGLEVDNVTLSFPVIDPLLITVKSVDDPWSLPFFVVLTGTGNAKFVSGQQAIYQGDRWHLDALNRPNHPVHFDKLAAATAPCLDGEQKSGYVRTAFGD